MLNKEEEYRVAAVIDVTKADIAAGNNLDFKPEAILWLAKKLKEVNDECSKYAEELYKTNKEFADYIERYEG